MASSLERASNALKKVNLTISDSPSSLTDEQVNFLKECYDILASRGLVHNHKIRTLWANRQAAARRQEYYDQVRKGGTLHGEDAVGLPPSEHKTITLSPFTKGKVKGKTSLGEIDKTQNFLQEEKQSKYGLESKCDICCSIFDHEQNLVLQVLIPNGLDKNKRELGKIARLNIWEKLEKRGKEQIQKIEKGNKPSRDSCSILLMDIWDDPDVQYFIGKDLVQEARELFTNKEKNDVPNF